MNVAKWNDPAVTLPILALKLAEEAAEVGSVVTDNFMGDLSAEDSRHDILKELDHVEAIVSVIRTRIGFRHPADMRPA